MAGRYMRVSSPRYSNQREHRLLPSDFRVWECIRAGFPRHVCGNAFPLALPRGPSLLVYCPARPEFARSFAGESDDNYRGALWHRSCPCSASRSHQAFAGCFCCCYSRFVQGALSPGLSLCSANPAGRTLLPACLGVHSLPHRPPRLSRPWTASLISTSELLVTFRQWGKGGSQFGLRDIVGRTWHSSAPRCF